MRVGGEYVRGWVGVRVWMSVCVCVWVARCCCSIPAPTYPLFLSPQDNGAQARGDAEICGAL